MNKEILVSDNLIKLATASSSLGKQIYIVGGYVRNSLLNLKTTDIDIAGNLNQEEMLKLCSELNFYCSIISQKLGTLLIKVKDEQYEYTAFREECYSEGGSHTPEVVKFVDSLEDDAKRRDFTINSLYYNPLTKEIIDTVGGISDLESKTIRCIISPEHVFKSDGLRILRFIRFGFELNFKFDKQSYKVAKKQISNLQDISKVRMLKELKDILISDTKHEISNLQYKSAIKLFNDFNIYKYLFNNSFNNLKISMHGKLFKSFVNTTKANRFYIFMVLVLFNYFNKKPTSSANTHFVLNTILGNAGLQESKENINKIASLYVVFQEFIFNKKVTNEFCVRYNELGRVTKDFFVNLNSEKVNLIEKQIEKMKSNNVPFTVGEVSVTSSELLSSGIKPRLISKIKIILYNECLQENVVNNKDVLISYAKELNNKLS